MAILIRSDTRVIVQGITGHQGQFHARAMAASDTKVVAGVTPGKGGQLVDMIPVFDTVREAVESTGANAWVCFVPAAMAKDAAYEAIDHELNPIVIITEHIPIHDTVKIVSLAASRKIRVVGPNTAGLFAPGLCKMGIMPAHIFRPGPIGLVSRSGTLTYEIVSQLSRHGFGQSTAVGLGGDPVVGLSFIEVLGLFEQDPETKAVVLIGEIGGSAEEEAARFIPGNITKPVFAYIAGRTAPAGKRMGHAGALISGTSGSAEAKIKALAEAGVFVAQLPGDLPRLVEQTLRGSEVR
jgi:succinyl-CoA synthetase alpha subunit